MADEQRVMGFDFGEQWVDKFPVPSPDAVFSVSAGLSAPLNGVVLWVRQNTPHSVPAIWLNVPSAGLPPSDLHPGRTGEHLMMVYHDGKQMRIPQGGREGDAIHDRRRLTVLLGGLFTLTVDYSLKHP